MFLFITALLTLASPGHSGEHVIVRYDELKDDVQEFQAQKSTGNYSVMLLEGDKLLVGSRDYITSIELADFSKYQMQYWKPEGDSGGCLVNGCPNFVKVVLKFSDKLFVCGTNGNSPVCSWRNLSDLSAVSPGTKHGDLEFKDRISGYGLMPSDTSAVNVAVITESGKYFFVSPRAKWRIFSSDFQSGLQLFTSEEWFSDAHFVRSFVIGQYVYFFFHEDAKEYAPCGKRRIARVARICKGDEGGVAVMKNKFVTFNKATLSCAIPGQYPFDFNQIQDVVWDAASSMFHAAFTTQPNQAPRSAICSFSMSKIEDAFRGDFKHQEDSKGLWETASNPLYFPQCSVKSGITSGGPTEPGKMPTRSLTLEALIKCNTYQLMARIVQPERKPFVHDGVGFTSLAADDVGGHEIFYTGTDKGSVLKISNSCILEEINVFPTRAAQRIAKLQLDAQRKALYIGSDSRLLKLHLERCSSRGPRKRACVEAADPYCGWDKRQQRCVPWRGSPNNLKQNLSTCPVPKAEKWSEWRTCRQADGNLCRCRTRPCAASNASSCVGDVELQLRNCTMDWDADTDVEADWVEHGVQHGNWSKWTDWSACSVTMGTGQVIRSRTCSNPAPRRGGRACVGLSHDSRACTRNPAVQEKETTQWTEYGLELAQRQTAVQYQVTCRAVGFDVTNVSASVTSSRSVNCTRNKKICKEGHWDEWQAWGECVRVGSRLRRRQCVERPCWGEGVQQERCTPPTPTGDTTPTSQTTSTPTKTTTSEITEGPKPVEPVEPVEPTVVDKSWGDWSKCECQSSTKLLLQNEDKSLGLQFRVPKCRGQCPVHKTCPKDEVDFRTCSCANSGTVVLGHRQSTKRSYSLELLIAVVAGAVIFSIVCIAIAVLCLRRRRRSDFDVSRASKKNNDNVFEPNSRYQSTPRNRSDNSDYDRVCTDDSKFTHIELKGGSTSSENSSRSKDGNKNCKQHSRVSWSPRRIKNLVCRPKDWAGSQEMI